MDFAVPVDHRQNGKRDKGLDLTIELKNLWFTKVTVIPTVIGAFRMTPKGLVRDMGELEIQERAKTIQTTAVLRSPIILRRVLETRGDCCYSDISEIASANAGGKKLAINNNYNNDNNMDQPGPITEATIIWDFSIQTDGKIKSKEKDAF